MKYYISAIYSHRIARGFLGLGRKRFVSRLIGFYINGPKASAQCYDLSYRPHVRDQYSSPSAYACLPSLADTRWMNREDILAQVRRVFADAGANMSYIVTEGDPIACGLIAALLSEAGIETPYWGNLFQRLYDAANWLPDTSYGYTSDFLVYYPDAEERADHLSRIDMFESHNDIEHLVTGLRNADTLYDMNMRLKRLDQAIDHTMKMEVVKLQIDKEPDTIAEEMDGE